MLHRAAMVLIACEQNDSHGGNMTPKRAPGSLMWRKLYHLAMMESDLTKVPPLLDEAINAVLDQMDETVTYRALEELNDALNALRSHRKLVTCGKSGGRLAKSQEPSAA